MLHDFPLVIQCVSSRNLFELMFVTTFSHKCKKLLYDLHTKDLERRQTFMVNLGMHNFPYLT